MTAEGHAQSSVVVDSNAPCLSAVKRLRRNGLPPDAEWMLYLFHICALPNETRIQSLCSRICKFAAPILAFV